MPSAIPKGVLARKLLVSPCLALIKISSFSDQITEHWKTELHILDFYFPQKSITHKHNVGLHGFLC